MGAGTFRDFLNSPVKTDVVWDAVYLLVERDTVFEI